MEVHRRVWLDRKGRLLAPDYIQRHIGQQGVHDVFGLTGRLVGDEGQLIAPAFQLPQQLGNTVINPCLVAAVGQITGVVPRKQLLQKRLFVLCQRPAAEVFHAVAHHFVILFGCKGGLIQTFQRVIHGGSYIVNAVDQRAVQIKQNGFAH